MPMQATFAPGELERQIALWNRKIVPQKFRLLGGNYYLMGRSSHGTISLMVRYADLSAPKKYPGWVRSARTVRLELAIGPQQLHGACPDLQGQPPSSEPAVGL